MLCRANNGVDGPGKTSIGVLDGVGELDGRENFSSLLRYLSYILGPTITLVLLLIGALLIERRILRA